MIKLVGVLNTINHIYIKWLQILDDDIPKEIENNILKYSDVLKNWNKPRSGCSFFEIKLNKLIIIKMSEQTFLGYEFNYLNNINKNYIKMDGVEGNNYYEYRRKLIKLKKYKEHLKK